MNRLALGKRSHPNDLSEDDSSNNSGRTRVLEPDSTTVGSPKSEALAKVISPEEWGMIDHSYLIEQELSEKKPEDETCDVTFLVGRSRFKSHRHVLQIMANHRPLIRSLLEKERQSTVAMNMPETRTFNISGTTPEAFADLLDYIYTKKVNLSELGESRVLGLAQTGIKLRFHELVGAIAERIEPMILFDLKPSNVSAIYDIAKFAQSQRLQSRCVEYLERSSARIMDDSTMRFIDLKKMAVNEPNAKSIYEVRLSEPRYVNYLQFQLPDVDRQDIKFVIKVSTDEVQWETVVDNELYWSRNWQWYYIKERRIKYIRVICLQKQSDHAFAIDKFECKHVSQELEFDKETGHLMPSHNVCVYPEKDFKHYFCRINDLFTYCMSNVSKPKMKYTCYYYHHIGDGKHLNFYLRQTCIVDSMRFHLWDEDNRTYDYVVSVRDDPNDVNNWRDLVKKKDARSWQMVRFKPTPVRWIRLTGTRGPDHDPEFAVLHFECPSQHENNKSGR